MASLHSYVTHFAPGEYLSYALYPARHVPMQAVCEREGYQFAAYTLHEEETTCKFCLRWLLKNPLHNAAQP